MRFQAFYVIQLTHAIPVTCRTDLLDFVTIYFNLTWGFKVYQIPELYVAESFFLGFMQIDSYIMNLVSE